MRNRLKVGDRVEVTEGISFDFIGAFIYPHDVGIIIDVDSESGECMIELDRKCAALECWMNRFPADPHQLRRIVTHKNGFRLYLVPAVAACFLMMGGTIGAIPASFTRVNTRTSCYPKARIENNGLELIGFHKPLHG